MFKPGRLNRGGPALQALCARIGGVPSRGVGAGRRIRMSARWLPRGARVPAPHPEHP
ncbi:hypothetical protein Lokhon_01813 [Limimaricola hongkongensis DSM 17492]|uniref:Uncharacterized protein n=1 Tax=Limimaricola hongkongensis DSM 17492 TaxID=1122180 RepID=A0A017HC63_9RHOB|nr:hypothetical protein Lokhon_01813 [Limimaricola hongkongensis DSM 17492]